MICMIHAFFALFAPLLKESLMDRTEISHEAFLREWAPNKRWCVKSELFWHPQHIR